MSLKSTEKIRTMNLWTMIWFLLKTRVESFWVNAPDCITRDVIPLIKRLKENETVRLISSAEGALVVPPNEIPMESQL